MLLSFLIFQKGIMNLGKNELCCIVYVLVTSYRAAFPRDVLYKTCFVEIDSIFFSPIADRVLAAIAELCFALQQVYWTHDIANQLRVKLALPGVENVAQCVCYVILFAQCLCFCGVFTSYPLFHALENSLWGVCAFLVVLDSSSFYYHMRPKLDADIKAFLKLTIVVCIVFMSFLVTHDIPIWLNMTWDLTVVTPPQVGFANSLVCKFTQDFNDWKHNVAWLILYNSVALWTSMYLGFRTTVRNLATVVRTTSSENLRNNFEKLKDDAERLVADARMMLENSLGQHNKVD